MKRIVVLVAFLVWIVVLFVSAVTVLPVMMFEWCSPYTVSNITNKLLHALVED